jgi:ubiquinone/menaquinone biosynthesis C-methylase UbiE
VANPPPSEPHGHGGHHRHGHRHGHGQRDGHGGDDHKHEHGVAHDFSDTAKWTARFDDPARDGWQKPDEVVKLLGMTPGTTVVDLGAGTGYFGKRLSAAVGPSGKVLALDPEPKMVEYMKGRFEKEGLTNIEPRACPFDGTGLGAETVDRVLIVDTWHHIEGRPAYAKHLASILKPGGAVMVVDFTLETEKGPPKEHRVGPQAVIEELRAGGLDARVVDESLPDQYIVVGSK